MITIFSLQTCEILGVINKGEINLPMSIDLEDIDLDDNVAKRDAKDGRNHEFRISKQARSGIWHQHLKESLMMNSDNCGSDIFQSIWDANAGHGPYGKF